MWRVVQVGLGYVVQTAERFFAVSAVLSNMVLALPEQPSVRLLKHIIRCYLRLSDNSRARDALRQCLPKLLFDPSFTSCLADDAQTRGRASACFAACSFTCPFLYIACISINSCLHPFQRYFFAAAVHADAAGASLSAV